MNHPKFLSMLTLFKELLEKGEVFCKKEGVKVKVTKNLFREEVFFINEKEHIILPSDSFEEKLTNVYFPLFRVLAEEEKFMMFNEVVNLSKIKNYHTFNHFLEEGIYDSEETSESVELSAKFVLLEEEEYTYYLHEDDITKENIENIHPAFSIILNYEVIDLIDWREDSKLRMRALLDPSHNPNSYLTMHLDEIFDIEEAIYLAKNHPLVSIHYSDFHDKVIAFNIKVYEDFVHKDLFDLKVLTYEEENENRNDAVENLKEELKEKESVHQIMIDGKNGGYLLVEFADLTPSSFKEVVSIIETAKKESYKTYQNIEHYKYYDYVLEPLKEKKELFEKNKDKENLEKINALIKRLT